jgi:lariat debranching enzyme
VKEVAPKNDEEIDLDMDDDIPTPAPAQATSKNDAEIDLYMDDEDDSAAPTHPPPPKVANGDAPKANSHINAAAPAASEVPEDIRNLLPSAFTRPATEARPQAQYLPPPEDIKNTTTQFLALDKCLPNRNFLQLMEVEPLEPAPFTRPLRLSYDREWLAITRVFASDLVLGDPEARVPFDQGDTHYRPLIEKEELWVEEQIVNTGKMEIPEDFHITATPYDPAVGERVVEQPLEHNNAHTQGFCDLLQIPNPFHAEVEEMRERVKKGPRPDSQRDNSRGGFGRGRGGRGGGRGGRGDRGGGRGFGRGRGRGRGWS